MTIFKTYDGATVYRIAGETLISLSFGVSRSSWWRKTLFDLGILYQTTTDRVFLPPDAATEEWSLVRAPHDCVAALVPLWAISVLSPDTPKTLLAWVADQPIEVRAALNLTAEIDPGACRRWAAELWEEACSTAGNGPSQDSSIGQD